MFLAGGARCRRCRRCQSASLPKSPRPASHPCKSASEAPGGRTRHSGLERANISFGTTTSGTITVGAGGASKHSLQSLPMPPVPASRARLSPGGLQARRRWRQRRQRLEAVAAVEEDLLRSAEPLSPSPLRAADPCSVGAASALQPRGGQQAERQLSRVKQDYLKLRLGALGVARALGAGTYKTRNIRARFSKLTVSAEAAAGSSGLGLESASTSRCKETAEQLPEAFAAWTAGTGGAASESARHESHGVNPMTLPTAFR